MAKVQHTCTGCVPIDASIIDVYVTLVETNKFVTNAESSRSEAEAARVAAESQRTTTFANDHGRAVSDHQNAQTAIANANAAAAAANAAGITSANATVDANTGTPYVDVSLHNKNLSLSFHNIKGEKGDKGDKGDSAIPVVNDLTTGGASSALSAEMGKTLNTSKQDSIPDINTIRSGAAAGAESSSRPYDSQSPNGMGYLVLEKDKTFAEQVTDTNTTYEIRYDFDLNNSTVTIPAGCVLRFNGGKIVNGTITGNGTQIEASPSQIFSEVTIAGTWNVSRIFSVWFEKDKYTIGNLLLMNNASINTEIYIDGEYDAYIPTSQTQDGISGLFVYGNTTIYINGFVRKDGTSASPNTAVFTLTGTNVTIVGGTIDGNKSAFSTSSEYGHGLDIRSGSGIKIIRVKIKDCRGDGIYAGGSTTSTGISLEGCEIVGCRRNGVAIINASTISILDSYIHSINGVSPKSAIDLEPNSDSNVVKNVYVNNCKIEDCGYFLAISGRANSKISNVLVENSSITFTDFTTCASASHAEYVSFNNCIFNLSGRTGSYCFSSSNLSGRWDFNHCYIKDTSSSGTLSAAVANFINCVIESGATIVNPFNARFVRCTITGSKDFCPKGSTLGGLIDTCTITVLSELNISGTSSSYAKGYVIKNSTINITAPYYPITGNYVENVRIENNIMNLVGNRNLINFTYANNVYVNDNTITVGSNNNGIAFDANSSECEASANIFKVATGVTWTSMRYSGINKDTVATNRKGVPFFSETSSKMVVYNGTSVVNVDGSALTDKYPKYVLCADEAEYEAISPKDSGTLYLIPEA